MPVELQSLLDSINSQPMIRGSSILACAILAAFLANWIFTRLLHQIAKRTVSDVDDQIFNILHRPVFWTFLLLGVSFSLQPIGLIDRPAEIIRSVAKTTLILLWATATIRLIRTLARALAAKPSAHGMIQTRTIPLIDNLALAAIIVGSLYSILVGWQIDVTGFVASAGIMGLAIGFAAKDTLANLFSGIFIIVDAPYQLGDYINLDSGERGMVTHIGLRSTRLLTRDDVEIIVPNSVIGNAKIINETQGPYKKVRIKISVGVSYNERIEKVEEILLRLAEKEDHVCSDPAPRVRFRRFGASSLDFDLLVWIKEPELRGFVTHSMLTHVYNAFRDAGIEIPYSKQDIYIKELPERE